MKPSALDSLTSLRFFAAASIVLFHMQGTLLPTGHTPVLALGVSFFFVLSGFILAYVYPNGIEPKRFYLARFARLWPVHAATLALTLWLLVPHLLGRSEWTGPLVLNALMLHAWAPITGYVFSFNAVSWSISTEMFFYLLFPLLMTKHLKLVIAIVAAVTLWCLFVLEIASVETGNNLWHLSPTHFVLQHPIMRVLEFAVGVAAGRHFTRRRLDLPHATAFEVAALCAVVLFAVASSFFPSSSTGRWLGQSGGMLIFAAAIYIIANQKGAVSRTLAFRPLVILGEISFSTYMLHQIVIRYAVAHQWPATLGSVWTPIAVITIVYGGSYALWRIVEEPSREFIVGYWSRRITRIVKSSAVKSTAAV